MAKTWITDVCRNIFLALGTCIMVTGLSLLFTWQSIVQSIIEKEMVLKPDSESFKIWRDTPVPMYMNFYVFNWTNPLQLGKETPVFSELGPFRFNMKERKTHIQWHDNGTVSYRVKRFWYHDPLRSNGSLEQVVTTLNPVALSGAKTVKNWNVFLKKSFSVSATTTGQEVFIKKPVGDLLFRGYADPLLTLASQMPALAGIDLPYDKFGWFYLRNGSSNFEGHFNMDTGQNGMENFGRLWRWNHGTETGFYDGECGRVTGSAGELFPPKQSPHKNIVMYSADLCRSLRLVFSEETWSEDIKGYKYVGDAWNMDNGTLDAGNECFCDGQCSPMGVVNVTSCRYGAPGFVSYPHFLHGDPFYRQQVHGLSPKISRHSLYITLEPETGIPLDVAARFQINLLLSPVPGVSLYEEVPRVFFPMIWFEQRAGISHELAHQLRLVLDLPRIGKLVFSVAVAVGVIIIIFTICLTCKYDKRSNLAISGDSMKLNDRSTKPLMKTAY